MTTSPQQAHRQLCQKQIKAVFPSRLVETRLGNFCQENDLVNFLSHLPGEPQSPHPCFTAVRRNYKDCVASLPQHPDISGMQFVSLQSNSRNGIRSKCCFMEVIDKTGCSLRKGKMECLHFSKTPSGQQGGISAHGKALV